ncbi:MAG TPA: PLP-dependent aminotransferase family protein [Myxococcota bacterium]|jgi:GntR family transcriptional regulator/MocR family aminotransferase
MQLEIRRDDINGRAAEPVYRQIAAQIRAQVERGELEEGDRLPPIRELAVTLGVNRETVSSAYEELAAQGVVDAQVGRGTYVRGRRPRGFAPVAPAPAPLSARAERLLEFERSRVSYGAGRGAVAFHKLVPDARHFPADAFRRSLMRAMTELGAQLLGYGDPRGYQGLRVLIAEQLRANGVVVGPDELVLCQGASQGIALALRLFADTGDAVAVEEPTYQNALAALAALGLRAVPVPMRRGGADLDALDRAFARPEVKALYTIPTFHNPMGISTSQEHRRELLAIAARHGKAVIEDAYEMDLRYAGRPIASLAGLDDEGQVVQLLSFSKSLFPGVRIGAIVARGRHIDAVLALRHAADLGGALPLQAGLADFMSTGAYDRHLASQRKRLRARRDAMLAALRAEMPEGASWTEPEGGLQLWVELPAPLDSRELYADALRAGVLVAPGFQFQCDGRASRGFRLSIGSVNEAEIAEGVQRLGKVIRERLETGVSSGRGSVHI